jgi:outer membrane protein TolC
MHRTHTQLFLAILTFSLLLGVPASAQVLFPTIQNPPPVTPAPPGPFSGAVPTGQRTAEPLSLTLGDAVTRGLQHNLGILTREEEVESARGGRWQALSAVLPNVSGRLAADREVINLAALGFSDFPGVPAVIGPFNVFDARLAISQPVVDPSGLLRLRESGQMLEAARHTYRNARDLVVLAVTNLYLQSLSADSRVTAARAQLETAEVLERVADDRRRSGLVPAIDVLRAQVELENARQRLIASENSAAKQKLALARAIGLPLGQAVALADPMPAATAFPVPQLDDAVQQAYTHRDDLQSIASELAAAESAAKAATAERLPSLGVDANWGAIGQTPADAVPTYTMSATVRVPLFNAGASRAHAIEAAGTLKRRRAELEDARGKVFYEISAALLDVASAQQQADVAAKSVDLAEQQLVQARDRFGAGVADTIEVVQAQEAVARAHEIRIGSLYASNAARAALAAAMGLAEEEMPRFLGVTK